MLKRTLVSVALLAAFNANAASVVSSTLAANDYSWEGTQGLDQLLASAVTVTVNSDLIVNDSITVTFSSPLDEDLDSGDLTLGGTFTGTLSIDSVSGSEVVLKVTAVASATSGTTVILSGVDIDTDPVRATSKLATAKFGASAGDRVVTVSAKVNRANGDLVETVAANGEVAVIAMDEQFAINDANVTDSLSSTAQFSAAKTIALNVTEVTSLVSAATYVNNVTTLTGDFSFLKDTNTSLAGLQASAGAVTAIGGTDASTVSSVTYTGTGAMTDGAANGSITLDTTDGDFYATASTAVSPQIVSRSTVINYTDAASADRSVTLTDSNVLDITYSGDVAIVRAMPIGSNVEQFLWVTNSTATNYTASMIFTVDGTTYGPYLAGTVSKNATTRLSSQLNEAFAAEGLTSGRAEVTVVFSNSVARVNGAVESENTDGSVTTKYPNLDVYAGYKVVTADDRLNLPVILK